MAKPDDDKTWKRRIFNPGEKIKHLATGARGRVIEVYVDKKLPVMVKVKWDTMPFPDDMEWHRPWDLKLID